jgi:hypothetical protein
MDKPKNVAERYDWKYIVIIAKVKVELDCISYLYIYINIGTQRRYDTWKNKTKNF